MYRSLIVAALSAMVGTALPAARDETPSPPPIALDTAARAFELAKLLSDADNGALWGESLYGPMLFVDRATRYVVANEADPEGLLSERDGVWTGTLPDNIMTANTAIEWSGQEWTMVLWPLPQNRHERGKLMVHEMFHRIQDEVGLPARDAVNAHLDSHEGRLWLRLEMRALAEAMIQQGEARRDAAADAIRFREFRRSLLPGGVEAENALELNEGVAEYTGFMASGWPAWVVPDRIAVQLEQYDRQPTFVRNFAYATGPAYCVLLDEFAPGWREDSGSLSDLGRRLAEALKIDASESTTDEVLQIASQYDGDAVVQQEAEREQQRVSQQQRFRERFVDQPTLTLPASDSTSYSFNPNAVAAFEDRGAVYLTATVRDEWGILTVTDGGVLMEREDGRVNRWIVPAPADPARRPVQGPGWTLELNEGWAIERDGEGSRQWIVRQD